MAAITAERRSRLAVLAAVVGLLLAALAAHPGPASATNAPRHPALTAGIAHELAAVHSLATTAKSPRSPVLDTVLSPAALLVVTLGIALLARTPGRDRLPTALRGLPSGRAPPLRR